MLAFFLTFVVFATCGGTVAGLLERRLEAARVPVPAGRARPRTPGRR